MVHEGILRGERFMRFGRIVHEMGGCDRGFGILGGIMKRKYGKGWDVVAFFYRSVVIAQVKVWSGGVIFKGSVVEVVFGNYSNLEERECLVGGRLNQTRENMVEGLGT